MNFRERGMGFGQLMVQLKRLQSSGLRLREDRLGVTEQVLGQQRAGVRQPYPSPGKVRVEAYHLARAFHRARQPCFAPLVPEVTPFDVKLIDLDVVSAAFAIVATAIDFLEEVVRLDE